MRKKSSKTKRDFLTTQDQSPLDLEQTLLESFEGFSVEDSAWYRVSQSMPSYSCGTIKEIRKSSDGVTFFIWDRDRGMWRCLTREDIHKQKPPRKKRGS